MNTYGDIGNATAGWLFTRLLSRAITVQVLEMFAMQATIPPNQKKVAQFQRLVPFPAATTSLTEGVPPDPDEVTYETISVIVQRFGRWAKITDVVDDHSKQNVLGHIVELQGDQIALTRELIHFDTMRSGTNVAYGGNATSRATLEKGDVLTAVKLDAIDRLLSSLKAKHITEILSPGLDYAPFSGLAGTATSASLRRVPAPPCRFIFFRTAPRRRDDGRTMRNRLRNPPRGG